MKYLISILFLLSSLCSLSLFANESLKKGAQFFTAAKYDSAIVCYNNFLNGNKNLADSIKASVLIKRGRANQLNQKETLLQEVLQE